MREVTQHVTAWTHERRGRLAYWDGANVVEFVGWVRADGDRIIARRVGGRRTWFICRSRDVVRFTADDTAGARAKAIR